MPTYAFITLSGTHRTKFVRHNLKNKAIMDLFLNDQNPEKTRLPFIHKAFADVTIVILVLVSNAGWWC